MTDARDEELEKEALENCPRDLNWRKECDDNLCGAKKSWQEGYVVAAKAERERSKDALDECLQDLKAAMSLGEANLAAERGTEYMLGRRRGFVAGAKAQRARAKALEEALEKIMKYMSPYTSCEPDESDDVSDILYVKLREALAQYRAGREGKCTCGTAVDWAHEPGCEK